MFDRSRLANLDGRSLFDFQQPAAASSHYRALACNTLEGLALGTVHACSEPSAHFVLLVLGTVAELSLLGAHPLLFVATTDLFGFVLGAIAFVLVPDAVGNPLGSLADLDFLEPFALFEVAVGSADFVALMAGTILLVFVAGAVLLLAAFGTVGLLAISLAESNLAKTFAISATASRSVTMALANSLVGIRVPVPGVGTFADTPPTHSSARSGRSCVNLAATAGVAVVVSAAVSAAAAATAFTPTRAMG
jgi:hypothetical protein